ncbi:hypothetical protein BCY86_00735 [Pajaroellobacter abortibovis]|uniref:Uncharacterized protein n=1 Tax=Pajaroellobacter abortibovis TaxID=1882918 RepID=A0A1L6MV48_9BACT|nr:hypothetical protein BCY86_00735 [Pajaroellobacter abortibovis]
MRRSWNTVVPGEIYTLLNKLISFTQETLNYLRDIHALKTLEISTDNDWKREHVEQIREMLPHLNHFISHSIGNIELKSLEEFSKFTQLEILKLGDYIHRTNNWILLCFPRLKQFEITVDITDKEILFQLLRSMLALQELNLTITHTSNSQNIPVLDEDDIRRIATNKEIQYPLGKLIKPPRSI